MHEERGLRWGMGLMSAEQRWRPGEGLRGLVGFWRLLSHPCRHGDGSGEVGKASLHEVAFALGTRDVIHGKVVTVSRGQAQH